MIRLIACFLIACAIVTTVVILPSSNWIFQNQLDLVARFAAQSPESRNRNANFQDLDTFTPLWITDPKTYTGSEKDEVLTHALYLPRETRNAAFGEYNKKYPKDVLGWAVTVRMTCMTGSHAPDDPIPTGKTLPRPASADLPQGIEACRQGQLIEPNNAYFPLMLAEFYMEQSRLDDMRQALRLAASKPGYDNHITDQGFAMEHAQVLAKGYRGEIIKTAIDASLLLPDFAHIKSLAKYLNRKGTLSDKRDLIQVVHVMQAGESTAIGLLVAFANIKLCLREPLLVTGTAAPKLSDAQWLQLAATFDDKLKAAHLAPPVTGTLKTYEDLNRLVAATEKYVKSQVSVFEQAATDSDLMRVVLLTIAPYVALAALVFSLISSALSWAFTRIKSDTFRAMTPHLICLPVWGVGVLLISSRNNNAFSLWGAVIGSGQLGLGLLLLGKHPAMPRVARIGGALLAVISFFVQDPASAFEGIAYAAAVGLTWEDKSEKINKVLAWLTVIASLVISTGVGLVVTLDGAFNSAFSADVKAMGLIGVFVAAMYVRKSARTAELTACVSMILFSALYLVSSGLEVRENRRLSLSRTTLMNEGNNIRESAGFPPRDTSGNRSGENRFQP